MRCSRRFESLVGKWWGRDERSSRDSPPRYLLAHFDAVAGETWKRCAARLMGHPSSTIRAARRRLPMGVRGALAWDMKTSGFDVESGNPHHAGGLHLPRAFTTSRGTTTRWSGPLHGAGASRGQGNRARNGKVPRSTPRMTSSRLDAEATAKTSIRATILVASA